MAQACTTVIVSGKATKDGRPLLFKNRDTPSLHSRIVYSLKGKYRFIGMVNPDDKDNRDVYNGHNSAGLAIMNSDSYNLNYPAVPEKERIDGIIMRKALETCATIEDFEKLLATYPKPWALSSNFGVIDAHGGAAYYETGKDGFTKYDVNDPRIAPFGYLIRTNYSFSGNRKDDKGICRFLKAQDLLYRAALVKGITPEFFLQDVSRCFVHGLTGMDLKTFHGDYAPFRDFIPRYYTASAEVVQGVKETESPLLTTGWTIIGSPLTSVIVPLWISNENTPLPKILKSDSNGKSQLDNWATSLKALLFPINRSEGQDYIYLPALFDEKEGIDLLVRNTDSNILAIVKPQLESWRNKGNINELELENLYKEIDQIVSQNYQKFTEKHNISVEP